MVSLRLLLLCLVLGPAVCKAGSQEGKIDVKLMRVRISWNTEPRLDSMRMG